jgi:N-acetyl-anhydromuramyl-L-alanine amidase AmpD
MTFRKITSSNPLRLPSEDKVKGISLHWTAGHYHQFFADYHFCIDKGGEVWQNEEADPGDTLSHTWHRNTGIVGIGAACMYNATDNNYGNEPITKQQIESMAALSAKIMKKYNIPMEMVKTHSEWAELDGYGPGSGDPQTRWDLWHEGPVVKAKILFYFNLKS